MKRVVFFLLVVVIVPVGCKKQPKTSWKDNPIPVEVLKIDADGSQTSRNYVGSICSEMSMPLSFPLGGTLTAVYVKNGQQVSKGKLLATVDNTGAKSMHDAALATLRQAEDGYARLKEVHEQGGISDVRWVQMETDLEKARQTEISTRKHLQDCSLYAPQDGVISMDDHAVGEDLRPLSAFAKLLDMKHLRVEFSVPEREVGMIKDGDEAVATLPALDNKEVRIRITDKSLLANPMGHTYQVKGRLLSDEEVLPGMVAKIKLDATGSHGIVIPSSCVHTMSNGLAVWVVRDSVVTRQSIKVSDYVRNGVLVSEGLQANDVVVTAGYQKLYNGARVSY